MCLFLSSGEGPSEGGNGEVGVPLCVKVERPQCFYSTARSLTLLVLRRAVAVQLMRVRDARGAHRLLKRWLPKWWNWVRPFYNLIQALCGRFPEWMCSVPVRRSIVSGVGRMWSWVARSRCFLNISRRLVDANAE